MTSQPEDGHLLTDLPPARRGAGTPYRIAVVCLGNICRSPIAEVVLSAKIDAAGLADQVEVVSAGIGSWHVGDPMDRRAAAVLVAHGYDSSRHRAQQFEADWLADYDLVLAMDGANFAAISSLYDSSGAASGDSPGHPPVVAMFRDFDPGAGDGDRDIPDPYFGGDEGFDSVLAMVERTSAAIVEVLLRRSNEH
ncbi:MAG TPA: low molecular weight protein-tyrosine-phosphatase [Nocardioidaceae bacterium]|nr:low molecular weight protein-tyrosine-phosphatase [Nocardioidaceae bacterium]